MLFSFKTYVYAYFCPGVVLLRYLGFEGNIVAYLRSRKVLHLLYEVIVELKKEVLDAEGRAICINLSSAGYSNLHEVNVSKRFILNLDAGLADAQEIADKFLTNPVSQVCTVRQLSD